MSFSDHVKLVSAHQPLALNVAWSRWRQKLARPGKADHVQASGKAPEGERRPGAQHGDQRQRVRRGRVAERRAARGQAPRVDLLRRLRQAARRAQGEEGARSGSGPLAQIHVPHVLATPGFHWVS